MSLAYIGPVPIGLWGNPTASWTSSPIPTGQRGASIGGVVSWREAQQLSELVANPARSRPFGGVIEYVWFSDELLSSFTGWYALSGFDITGEQRWSLEGVDGLVPFSVEGSYLGERRVRVISSSRQLANDFGLTGRWVLADPFYNEHADGSDPFVVASGGTLSQRAYDDEPFTSLGNKSTPIAGSPAPPVARKMGVYVE